MKVFDPSRTLNINHWTSAFKWLSVRKKTYLFVKSDNDVGRITRILPAICSKRKRMHETTAEEVTYVSTKVQT
jgi:hypothetical protein